jgi:hypothetical protein
MCSLDRREDFEDDDDDGPAGDDDAFTPTPEELAVLRRATPADAAAADALLTGALTAQWQGVGDLVGALLDAFEAALPSLPYVYLAVRLRALVDAGAVEVDGDLTDLRAGRVRLAAGGAR